MKINKNPPFLSSSSVKISSKHYIDSLENTIIQIAKAISVEQGIKIVPDAMLIVRDILQKKSNELLTDEQNNFIQQKIVHYINNSSDQFSQDVYDLLRIMNLS